MLNESLSNLGPNIPLITVMTLNSCLINYKPGEKVYIFTNAILNYTGYSLRIIYDNYNYAYLLNETDISAVCVVI